VVRWWSDHRLAGDEEIYQTATEWRRHSLHLADHWRNLQDQMTLRLREQYRVFAAEVAAKYRTLILENFNLREVAEPKPEEPQKTPGASYRQMVSPSVFRAALVNACRREGLEVRRVPAEYTTAMCHACRTIEAWDQAASVIHRCASCGALWDQDRNAAINLLASGQAMGTENQADSPGLPVSGDRSQTEGKQGMESVA
jgi:transposase